MEKKDHLDCDYNGFVCFDTPIVIVNDSNEPIPIYGLLYNINKLHLNDLGFWSLNRYICYLLGCENVQKNGGTLAHETWITPDENIISLNVEYKNFIYKTMRHKMIGYKLCESELPFDILEGESDDIFVISDEFLIRNEIYPIIQLVEVE